MRDAKKKTGRPPVLQPCPWCQREFGTVAYRAHIVKCTKRLSKRLRAALKEGK